MTVYVMAHLVAEVRKPSCYIDFMEWQIHNTIVGRCSSDGNNAISTVYRSLTFPSPGQVFKVLLFKQDGLVDAVVV
jgi:hypothetical protein